MTRQTMLSATTTEFLKVPFYHEQILERIPPPPQMVRRAAQLLRSRLCHFSKVTVDAASAHFILYCGYFCPFLQNARKSRSQLGSMLDATHGHPLHPAHEYAQCVWARQKRDDHPRLNLYQLDLECGSRSDNRGQMLYSKDIQRGQKRMVQEKKN